MAVCRVCAFKSDDFVDIFGPEGEDLFLAQKINDYLPIEVSLLLIYILVWLRCCYVDTLRTASVLFCRHGRDGG